MLDGIYVRTYDRVTIDEQKLVDYFQRRLKEDDWEILVKIKEESEVVEISLLFDEEMVYGIFAIVIPETSGEATFVNIVGEIAPERIEELLGNLSNFGAMDINVGDALKAQSKPVWDKVQRELLAVKIEEPPTIDGILDDACWKIAPEATNFTHVSNGNPVEDDSVVKLIYTDAAIYVAWYLRDSVPDKIVTYPDTRLYQIRDDRGLGFLQYRPAPHTSVFQPYLLHDKSARKKICALPKTGGK